MEAGPPSKAVAPPALLGKYELGRLLGRGTFAKVYYAQAVDGGGAAVAVKVIEKASVAASMQHRVLREISAMSRLQHHPNVLRLHEVMATRSKIFLVMELAAGGDLLSVVSRRGRLPEAAAHHYFRQLVSALRFCHARGVAHRDLKLANLLIDGAGYLKVSDFGLSSLAEQRHGGDGLLRTACGSPSYAAPEVVQRGGYDGARADAWSCGVVLYAMLAGRLPFDDGNLAVMYRKIYNGEYQFPAWFSPAAKRVISGLLDPDPETRLPLDALQELPWCKEFSAPDSGGVVFSGDGGAAPAAPINAFDIISLSSGLNLSRLFEQGTTKSFTSAGGALATILGRIAGEEEQSEFGKAPPEGVAAVPELKPPGGGWRVFEGFPWSGPRDMVSGCAG
ncbi:unnamed protein product [Spirodela intermedia]|uniref:non-specific serine/threonine protein kinase n=1 Tax=Spirodela intermedia TaxID=51605 RepID=A0A7I8K4S0_SPIIN|nr:unnamed protein product [Spirodela intermedia]